MDAPGSGKDFTNSPQLVHTPTIHFLAKEIFLSKKMFVNMAVIRNN